MDPLQENTLDRLAEKVANRLIENEEFIEKVGKAGGQAALDKFHMHVGKSIVDRLFWLIGTIAVAVWIWVEKNPPGG